MTNPPRNPNFPEYVGRTTVEADTVTVTPKPGGLEFLYRRVGEQDLISMVIDDHRIGRVEVALTPPLAQCAGAHLGALAADVDNLREQFLSGLEGPADV